MAQYTDILIDLGLAKNEARIYETLLKEGESAVGVIAVKSGIHRRNVYDSLNRLIERGLAFERITSTEHQFQANSPRKLIELVKEKENRIQTVLPELETLYSSVPHNDDVTVSRGIEGWKNYIRDIIRIGEDLYSIGAKGTWRDNRLHMIRKQFVSESAERDIRNYWLFDHDARKKHEPESYLSEGFTIEYRYLPPGFNTKTTVDIFGDRVVMVTDPTPSQVMEEFSVTTIINQHTADAFRTWHSLLWKMCEGSESK